MKAYSPEMRRDVLAMADEGVPTQEIALELNVSKSWVRRVKQEFREQGKTAPKLNRKRKQQWESHVDWLRAKVDAQPDIYLRELQATAQQELAWSPSINTLSVALIALGLSRKKRR